MSSPSNFLSASPVPQDDELVNQRILMERIKQQMERVQALEHSRQSLVERIEQQSERVQVFEDAMLEGQQLEGQQLITRTDKSKTPRSLAAEIER
jgi:hypothetical protein